MKPVAIAACTLLLLAACDSAAPSPPDAELGRPPAASSPLRERNASPGPRLSVHIDAPAPARRRIRTAIEDLRSIELWPGLTTHLFEVHISALEGASNVPEDEHLADAFYRPRVVRHSSGRYCGIRFYSKAMRDDLVRQRIYRAEGRLAEDPPSVRHFWAAVLAHELTHCRNDGSDEATALRVEGNVVDALQEQAVRR